MASLVVDTHAAIWYFLLDPRLSKVAEAALDAAFEAGDPVYLPSICLVELTYLVEKGRVLDTALNTLRNLLVEPASGLRLAYLDLPVTDALGWVPRNQVPDLPDRVIAATAVALNLPLVSRDRRIQAAQIQTIW